MGHWGGSWGLGGMVEDQVGAVGTGGIWPQVVLIASVLSIYHCDEMIHLAREGMTHTWESESDLALEV